MADFEIRTSCRRGFPGIRYVFTAMGFLGFCIVYAVRVNLNVAIVAMVNGSAVYTMNTSSHECESTTNHNVNTTVVPPMDGEFDWSPRMQAMVLGSFYYGYCVSQVPGGRLAEVYGAKWVFGFGTFISAVLTLFTPLAAKMNVYLLISARVIEGLVQGVTMPAMHAMIGRWLPDSEKGFLCTIIYCGMNIGTVITMPIAGILCNSTFLGGWPSAFYVFGAVGCLWFVLWSVAMSNSPVDHPWISKKELKYITDNQKFNHCDKLPPIPWFSILTSLPFWALIVTQFGQDYCFFTLLNDLPTFLGTVLHFNIEKSGLLSSLPYIFQTTVGCALGFVTDFCIRKKWISLNFVRKFCNTVASVGSAVCLIGVCLAGCNAKLIVFLFVASAATGGFCYCGYLLSHLDLSPEYAGTLMGISNTISNLTGFIAPAVVGSLIENYQTLRQWHIVFYITAGFLLITSVIYVLFVKTEKQNWSPAGSKCSIIYSEDEDSQSYSYGTFKESPIINSVVKDENS